MKTGRLSVVPHCQREDATAPKERRSVALQIGGLGLALLYVARMTRKGARTTTGNPLSANQSQVEVAIVLMVKSNATPILSLTILEGARMYVVILTLRRLVMTLKLAKNRAQILHLVVVHALKERRNAGPLNGRPATVRLRRLVAAMTKSSVTQMIGGLDPRVVLLLTPAVAHAPTDKRNAEPLKVMQAIVPVYAVRNRLVMIGPLTNLLPVLAGRRLVQLASHLMF